MSKISVALNEFTGVHLTSEQLIQFASAVIKTAVDLTPYVIQTAADAKDFAEIIADAYKGNPITIERLDALEAKIVARSKIIQNPLPPATPDDDI